MSSTNRGYERHKTDYYVTPKQCIKDFLNEWLLDVNSEFHDDVIGVGDRPDKMLWFDPCAGGDEKHQMSYPEVIFDLFEAPTMTMDIREDSLAEMKEDYLISDIIEPKPDVIITNPPFYIAQEVIKKALQDVKDDGYVVMLLRLNFFGSKARKIFFDQQMPTWAYVHNRRMSFTDDGKTDSIEYCHMVWQRGAYPKFTMLKII